MLKRLVSPALAATLLLAACDLGPTAPSNATLASDDYALVMFGEPGSSLEGTMGTDAGDRPFDGRTGRPQLPDSIKLTAEQITAIQTLRLEFRAAHLDQLEALRAIFIEARLARLGGASHEEVRAILMTGRDIADALRPDVQALHLAIRALLTDAQRAWLDAHRPRHLPRGPRRGPL